MDPILDRIALLEKKLDETHKLVVKIRKTQRNAAYMKIVYWGFIILIGLGSFYFIEPYLNQLKAIYNFTGLPHASNSTNYTDLIKSLTQ